MSGLLTTLSKGEREAIYLAYYGGHTYAEVAELLHQPEGTIKSRIRTGLRRLRSLLDDGAEDDITDAALDLAPGKPVGRKARGGRPRSPRVVDERGDDMCSHPHDVPPVADAAPTSNRPSA